MAAQANTAAAASENARKDDDFSDDSAEAAFLSRCCCFWKFPRKSAEWERISTSEVESPERNRRSWWGSGVRALMKVREWSELLAGPKWKTFIRRFNRTGSRSKAATFRYDPMSYALNFDEGEGQNGNYEDDRVFRGFSARYAAHNGQSK